MGQGDYLADDRNPLCELRVLCGLKSGRLCASAVLTPFFCRGKGHIGKGLLPIKSLTGMEICEKSFPHFDENTALCPLSEASPTCSKPWITLRQFCPLCSCRHDPHYPSVGMDDMLANSQTSNPRKTFAYFAILAVQRLCAFAVRK